jgi:hypothetical protein
MSDTTTMPFQPGTVSDEAVTAELADRAGNKRVLLMLGALAGLAVLVTAAYFLLFAGGNSDKAPNAVVSAPKTAAQPSTAPSTAPKTAALPNISARNFGTDPFKPLISEALPTVAATVPVTNPGTVPVTVPVTGPGTGPVVAPPTSIRFRVVDVAADNESARVNVGGTAATVKPGDVFSEKFKAIRFTDGSCGTFQFGDERFDLCEGKAVNVN